MPYTRRQIERIMRADLIPEGRMPYAGRVAESYLKRALFGLEDRAVREQFKAYRDAAKDIQNRAAELAQGGVDAAFKRDMMGYTRMRVNALYAEIARIAGQWTVQAYYAGYLGRLWALDMLTNDRAPLIRQGPDLALGMRRALLVEQGGEVVPWDDLLWELLGREWRATYALEQADLLVRLQRALNTGVRQGEGVQDIMRRVRDTLGVETDRRMGYRANFYRVQTITRTYVMSASNIGAADVYRANADVLTGSEHLTARDERVCAVCAGLDGTFYPLSVGWGDLPPNNTHPNCRCTVIPVIKDDYLSDLAGEPPRQTFDEWAAVNGLVALLAGVLMGRLVSTERI